MCAFILSSCEQAGVTENRLTGVEEDLPAELKELKIYDVSIGSGSYVKVAVLKNQVNSTTYPVGKYQQSLILVDNSTGNQITVSEILSETDSIIVCRK